MHVTLVSTAPPRVCGIATFTADLRTALRRAVPRWTVDVCAIDRDGFTYGSEVTTRIAQDEPDSYRRAARQLAAAGTDLVMIQHEFGIFGGPDGRHILLFADELRTAGVPYTVTLHTIVARPSRSQTETLATLCAGSSRVTVFTETARQMALGTGLATAEQLAVVPHGAPPVLRALVTPADVRPVVRQALDAAGDARVLATFGLIGPGKGLDHAIAALPAIVRRHPDVRYLIAGTTHPDVVRHAGESYRESLVTLAERAGVAEHVQFIDSFLTEPELAVLLARTHVYVTPYRSPEQICSGALTFAVAAGCPVVSTDYWYARDLLTPRDAPASGRIVPCGDVAGLADAIGELLIDGAARHAAHAAADALGATLTWPSVGRRFAEVALAAVGGPRGPVRAAQPIPVLRLDHLDTLTDEIGIVQFATGTKPDLDSGYCVDDVARLAIVAHGLVQLPGLADPRPARWLATAMRFLAAAQGRNLMGYDGSWLDDPHSGDHVGRAIWGLGVVASSTGDPLARRLIGELMPAVERLEFPRSIAYALLGLSQVDGYERAVATWAHRLAVDVNPDPDWLWYEPELTYDNARLPEALLRAAHRLDDRELLGRTLSTVDWYLAEVGLDQPDTGILRCVGNQWRTRVRTPEGCEGDEQPLDAAAVVELAVVAWQVTRDWRYARVARRAFGWFLGENQAGQPLYDEQTGGGRDGLSADGVNTNEGAESTLAYYQALLALVHSGLVRAPVPAVRLVRPRSAAAPEVLSADR